MESKEIDQVALAEPKKPFLAVGEIVEVKGVKFRVTALKPGYRLFLKMVRP